MRVWAPLDEPVALEAPHHVGHRLLAQAGAAGELSHLKPVLLEERKENRTVGRPDGHRSLLRAKRSARRLFSADDGLCEQEAEVVPVQGRRRLFRHCPLAHESRARMLSNSRSRDWYWASNRSSGMPGVWNIVKEYALRPSGSSTTRVGKRLKSVFRGPGVHVDDAGAWVCIDPRSRTLRARSQPLLSHLRT